MLRNLFDSFESDEAEQNFHNAMMEQLINGDVRDAYMSAIHDNSPSLMENQLMNDPLLENTFDDVNYDSTLEDLNSIEDLYECGSKCCDSYSDDGEDFVDSKTKYNIDLLPETDPTDVGSYFDSTSSTAAECNEAAYNRNVEDGMSMANIYIR